MSPNITKHLEDEIWELRPGFNRVLYFYFENNTFVLLHIFRKKTPKSEIEKAHKECNDYKNSKWRKRIMRTWEDFKKDAKELNTTTKEDIEEMEVLANIISSIIEKRNELGISQRELADICGLPHSSVARIESCAVKPKVETLIKIMKPLGLTLTAKTI